MRAGNLPLAPRPQACQCSEKLGFTRARRTKDEGSLPRLHDHLRFLERVGIGGRYDLEIIDRYDAGTALGVSDSAFIGARFLGSNQRVAETRHSKQRRAPIGNGAEIVYEPPQRGLCLGERAGGHHETAEGNLAREIQRRGNEYWSDYRNPTEPRGDPGQIGMPHDDAARSGKHIAKMHFDAAFLVRLPGRQRNIIDVLVDAHERKAQVRLARVTLGVAAYQASPDPVAQKRAGARVDNRRPYHETGDRIVPVVDTEREVIRENPEHAGEGPEQDRGLKEPYGEVRRKFGEVTRILVHTLIGIDAHRPGIGEPECPARLHPILEETVYEALAQSDLQHLGQPCLRHIEDEQKCRDQEKHAELVEKVSHVAARQSIVKRLIPTIEANLSVSRGNDDDYDGDHQQRERLAHRRAKDRTEHHSELSQQAQVGRLTLGCRAGDFC